MLGECHISFFILSSLYFYLTLSILGRYSDLGVSANLHISFYPPYTAVQIERICWLIAHHHTYQDVTSLDHRILLEADFLVNSFEAHLAPEGIITFRDHVFRSESAISMLNDMWGL